MGTQKKKKIKHQVIAIYFIGVKTAVVRWLSLHAGIPGIRNGGFAFAERMMTD